MQIEFSYEPIPAGTARPIRVQGKEPIRITTRCFTKKPPPAGNKLCPECGTFTVKPDQELLVRASYNTFRERGGELRVSVRDASGETEEFKLKVLGWGEPDALRGSWSFTDSPGGDVIDKPDVDTERKPVRFKIGIFRQSVDSKRKRNRKGTKGGS